MAKLTEKKSETEKATEALSGQFDALNIIAEHENAKEKSPSPSSEKTDTSSSKKKERKDQLVTFNLPVEDFDKYKSWFGSKGISMSMGLRMCLDYVFYQNKTEKIEVTKSGIRENDLMRLR